ncbi:MAG: LamG domain-containing protein, partial [Thermoplasmata archaeon]
MKKLAILMALALVASLLVFYGGQTAKASHPPGPVAYWPFDEGSGTTAFDSAHNNDGTLKNGPVYQGGADFAPIPSNVDALSFDGVDDFVEAANEANFDFERTDTFSISAWVKTSSNDIEDIVSRMGNTAPNRGYQLIKHQATGSGFGVPFGNRLYFFLINGFPGNMIRVAGSTDISDGQWHHVTVTYDGSSSASGVKIYLDGV